MAMEKLVAALWISCFLLCSEGRPVNDQHVGFATAEHVLIIGCDGFGESTAC